jgi:hypothetical protein
MDDYGLLEVHRDGALAEARNVAADLRRAATRIEALAEKAEASTDSDELVGKLAAGVLTELTGTLGNLGLGKLSQESADWAKVFAARGGSPSY